MATSPTWPLERGGGRLNRRKSFSHNQLLPRLGDAELRVAHGLHPGASVNHLGEHQ